MLDLQGQWVGMELENAKPHIYKCKCGSNEVELKHLGRVLHRLLICGETHDYSLQPHFRASGHGYPHSRMCYAQEAQRWDCKE